MQVKRVFESKVRNAFLEIASTISISQPYPTPHHINYFVNNLANNESQINNLCWAILGFVGKIFDKDQKIRTTIDAGLGVGEKLKENLSDTLKLAWLRKADDLTREQILKERNPFLLELIAHVILKIQKEEVALRFDNINPEYIRSPHSKANETGLDIIVLSNRNGQFTPLLGEVKAYKDDPKAGFTEACKMFRDINSGLHNTEIREYFCNLNLTGGIKQKISENFWTNQSSFSALIGHNNTSSLANDYQTQSDYAREVECSNLFLVSAPFQEMDELFELLIITMEKHIDELG